VSDVAPVRWGILGAASIAVRRVIPAMQKSALCRVEAIASRDIAKARAAAESLAIPRAYGSYEELLADPDLDAVYNPLPNHLHVPWSVRAAAAGKHVLCEKPIALSAAEARELLAARDRHGVRIGEAFMVRSHPQWHRARELVASGRIGELKAVTGHFSYHRRDPADVRNVPEWGGGALLDVGCYPITIARWLFGAEPTAVIGTLERDPEFGVDRLTAALLRFPTGVATFTVGSQIVHAQRVQIYGTSGRIELPIPFSPPSDWRARILVDDGRDVLGGGLETIELDPVDQFTRQADRFAEAIRGMGDVPVPLEDAIGNMAVMDAIFKSIETGRWEKPESF
jgi:predicted dehydrogenase